MPPKKSRGGPSRDPFHAFQIEKASGRYYLSMGPANANGIVSFGLTPAFLGTRLATIADLFLEFRFTNLRMSWLSSGTTVLGYYYQYEPNVPTSIAEASEGDYCLVHFINHFTPSRLQLPFRAMQGGRPLNWYRTIPSGADDNFEYQGMLYGAGVTTGQYLNVWIEYDIEFRSRSPSVVSFTRLPPPPLLSVTEGDGTSWADEKEVDNVVSPATEKSIENGMSEVESDKQKGSRARPAQRQVVPAPRQLSKLR